MTASEIVGWDGSGRSGEGLSVDGRSGQSGDGLWVQVVVVVGGRSGEFVVRAGHVVRFRVGHVDGGGRELEATGGASLRAAVRQNKPGVDAKRRVVVRDVDTLRGVVPSFRVREARRLFHGGAAVLRLRGHRRVFASLARRRGAFGHAAALRRLQLQIADLLRVELALADPIEAVLLRGEKISHLTLWMCSESRFSPVGTMEAYRCHLLHCVLAFLRLGTSLVRRDLGEALRDGARARLVHPESIGGLVHVHVEHVPGRLASSLVGRDVVTAGVWPAAIVVFIWFDGFRKLDGARLARSQAILRTVLS